VLREISILESALKDNLNFRKNMGTPQIEFHPESESCDICGQKNHVLKTEKRKVKTTEFGEFTVNETILYCPNDKYVDEEDKKIRRYESNELKQIVPDNKRHGFDVMCFAGQKKFLENKRRDEIYEELKSMQICVSTGTISNLCEEFLIYVKCVHESNWSKIKDMISKEGGYIIGMDATQDGNSDILFTARDCLQDIVLCAEKMPSEDSEYIKPVMEIQKEKLGNPLAIIVDMHKGEGKVCRDVFPNVPVIECNYHFLEGVGNYILSAEYSEIRNALTSGMKIQSTLTRILKELHRKVITNEYDIDQIFCAFKKKEFPEYINPDEFNISVSYLIVSWILSYRKDSNGDRFPFSLPYLDFYQRCKEMYQIIKKYVLFCKNRNHNREHLERVEKTIEKLFSKNKYANRARKSAMNLNIINLRFDELRRILRMHDVGDIPRDKLTIKSDEEIGEIKKSIMEFKTKLKEKVKFGKSCDANACRIILECLNRHEDKLFLSSITVTVDEIEKIIRFPRTNGDEEKGFGIIKSDAIKRTGKKDVGYILNLYGTHIALAQNLKNERYIKNIYGSIENMHNVFSEVTNEEFEKWKKKFYENKMGYGPAKKMDWKDFSYIGLVAIRFQKGKNILFFL